MSDKKAFVLDTNFIIENLKLKEVVSNLSDEFSVYVTQVSINERISQKYIELKKRYTELEAMIEKYQDIASIRILSSFEDRSEKDKKKTQKGYVELLGENIIPFSTDNIAYSQILDRVFKKIPPFSAVDGASDKGFKDSLIWVSLLEFFKHGGEEDVIFVTNDNSFRKNADDLCQEFNEYTGKVMIIRENGYYNALLSTKESGPSQLMTDTTLPNVKQLRERIHSIINSLCWIESENHWGDPIYEQTFTLNAQVDGAYMEFVFTHLKQDIMNNLLETSIPANRILGLDDRITDGVPIPMSALENALSLYKEIEQKTPDYLPQFYSAAATIINANFRAPLVIDYDVLPF